MVRVLMGPFGPLVRAGFADILRQESVQVLDVGSDDLLDRVGQSLPDVVLLDLDRAGSHELATWIATRFPTLTVVACSSRTPRMRVFPRFHHGECYESELATDLFTGVVRT